MENEINLKKFKIYLPNGDRKSFMIYNSLSELFGEKDEYAAAKKLRKTIKEWNITPVPQTYFEVSTGIRTSNPQIIFTVIKIIDALSIPEFKLNFSQAEWNVLNEKLSSWKGPKRQKWKVGDIFSIKLLDGDFAFGQVLSNTPTVALFDLKKSNYQVVISQLTERKIISIIHTTANDLNNHSWKVVTNSILLADADSGYDGRYSLRIGLSTYGSNVLSSICDYYWFGKNKWANPKEMEELIIK